MDVYLKSFDIIVKILTKRTLYPELYYINKKYYSWFNILRCTYFIFVMVINKVVSHNIL